MYAERTNVQSVSPPHLGQRGAGSPRRTLSSTRQLHAEAYVPEAMQGSRAFRTSADSSGAGRVRLTWNSGAGRAVYGAGGERRHLESAGGGAGVTWPSRNVKRR